MLPVFLGIAWVCGLFGAPYILPRLLASYVGNIATRNDIPKGALELVHAETIIWSRFIVGSFIAWWGALGCLLEFDWNPLIWITLGLGMIVFLAWSSGLFAIRRSLLKKFGALEDASDQFSD